MAKRCIITYVVNYSNKLSSEINKTKYINASIFKLGICLRHIHISYSIQLSYCAFLFRVQITNLYCNCMLYQSFRIPIYLISIKIIFLKEYLVQVCLGIMITNIFIFNHSKSFLPVINVRYRFLYFYDFVLPLMEVRI